MTRRDHHAKSPLASGLLMGLLYGLIAVGLALIFGLMDVVNFAHGEFLMIAMYAAFVLFAFFAIDPLLAAPLVAAALFVFGAVVYLADRALCDAGQGQCRHGADLLDLRARHRDARAGAVLLHAGLSQRPAFLARRQDVSIAGIFLPVPQLAGALVSIVAFGAL